MTGDCIGLLLGLDGENLSVSKKTILFIQYPHINIQRLSGEKPTLIKSFITITI